MHCEFRLSLWELDARKSRYVGNISEDVFGQEGEAPCGISEQAER
jgi:hypothetical protein